MKFPLTFCKRLLKIADLVEFDGEPFDYRYLNRCAWPRAREVMNLNKRVSCNGMMFGLDVGETFYLFNQGSCETLDRHAVAKRFREFVMDKLQVKRPKPKREVVGVARLAREVVHDLA